MILLWIDDSPEICTIVTAFCDRIGAFTVQIQIFFTTGFPAFITRLFSSPP